MHRRIDLYRTEVGSLKSFADSLERISERAGLPDELLPGELKLSVTAGKRALVENHRGILSFESTQVSIAARKGRVILRGEGLYIAAMSGDWIVISGKIQGAEWE